MLSRSHAHAPDRRRVIGVSRVGASGLAAALLLTSYVGLAWADTVPSPPSQAQVDAARVAVSDQQARVAALEAEYQRGVAELAVVQHTVSSSAKAYQAAQAAEREAATAAAAAALAADGAATAAAEAQTALSHLAAAAFEEGGGVGQQGLLHIFAAGPDTVLDMAQFLDDSADLVDRQLREAQLLAGAVESTRGIAVDRAQRLAAAVQESRAAQAQLESELGRASDQVAALAARQHTLTAELATLVGTSQAIQQQRLDALAEQAAAQARQQQLAAGQAAAGSLPQPTPTVRATDSRSTTSPSVPAAPVAPTVAAAPKPSIPPTPTTTPSPTPTATVTPPPPTDTANLAWMQTHPRTVAQQLMPGFGFGTDQWACLDSLWQNESSWSWSADNPYSDAYGIPQALPGTKMATAGADWLVNPATQIKWGLGYIKGRYGTPCQAWAAWQSRSPHWY